MSNENDMFMFLSTYFGFTSFLSIFSIDAIFLTSENGLQKVREIEEELQSAQIDDKSVILAR